MPLDPDIAFRAFPRLNEAEFRHVAGLKSRIDHRVGDLVDPDSMVGRVALALAEPRAIVLKELFEAFEFFERTRKRLRAPCVADLCCGHGLVGLLFGVFERRVERVVLLDSATNDNQRVVFEALAGVAPWLADKVTWHHARVEDAAELLPQRASVVAVHACGVRTDRAIDAAIAVEGAFAAMACCQSKAGHRGPESLRLALGASLATEIDRTYRLEAAGYRTVWTAVPASITPKNRILIAYPRGE